MTTDANDPLADFTDDPVRQVQNWAKPVVDARVGRLEQQIGQLQSDVTKERAMAALDADPEIGTKWRSMNSDPRFLEWVGEMDLLSGVPRVDLMRRAFASGDSERTARFFKAYLLSKIPTVQRTQHRLPYEGQSTAHIRAADLQPGRRIWSRAEIARFYSDAARGAYNERPVERQQIEAEILRAAKEGRVSDPPSQIDVK
jgi:hypothetical protein